MRVISADEIDAALTFPALVEALRDAFRADIVTPVRSHYPIARAPAADATLLLMPAWTEASARDGFIGTKIVSVFPDNAAKGKPSVVGVYLLFSGDTGEPLALMDGPRLTLWRTAAASALASSYLSRHDSERLAMVGSGALAPFLIRAHAAVRPIKHARVWNRRRDGAETVVEALKHDEVAVTIAEDLQQAVSAADVVSCATMSATPLVKGEWLHPGAHLDLVGAYRPTMRESDDVCVQRADLYCDTRAGATHEGGDLADPIARGLIKPDDILGDLFDLTRGKAEGRKHRGSITLFKSVGTALEDLAAATLVWRSLTR